MNKQEWIDRADKTQGAHDYCLRNGTSAMVRCSRCGGEGYSNRPDWAVHSNGVCFKCMGKGKVIGKVEISLAEAFDKLRNPIAQLAKWEANQAEQTANLEAEAEYWGSLSLCVDLEEDATEFFINKRVPKKVFALLCSAGMVWDSHKSMLKVRRCWEKWGAVVDALKANKLNAYDCNGNAAY